MPKRGAQDIYKAVSNKTVSCSIVSLSMPHSYEFGFATHGDGLVENITT
jgi:hypothetical protein